MFNDFVCFFQCRFVFFDVNEVLSQELYRTTTLFAKSELRLRYVRYIDY